MPQQVEKNNTTNLPREKMIHPIIIYPYVHPRDTQDLLALYDYVQTLEDKPSKFCHPITVVDRKTYNKTDYKEEYNEFWKNTVKKHSEPVESWNVDTCQNWYTGFGHAFDRSHQGDVFWLIPGDFNYASKQGQDVLRNFELMPDKVYEGDCELCLGEITVDPNSSKHLIDTYGTYGLLYNWFPEEAQGIRRRTDKPRTEFFAIGYDYLKFVLNRRWYPYEQTLIILLQAMRGREFLRSVKKIELGDISDLPRGREALSGAIQQVERTERALKMHWREVHEHDNDWPDRFRKLDFQSEQIRGAALVILQQILPAIV